MTPPVNRRDFLVQTTAATAALSATTATARAAARSLPKNATDRVTLGKSGVQVSLIGMGTGSVGVGQASNQTRLGVKQFTRIVRHAIDSGVTFFDVADQYGSHTYLREALKGVPREKYQIQTKTHASKANDARSHLERYRMELGTDYIDIVLLHCMQRNDWPQQNKAAMEYLAEAKSQGIIRTHGTSCHGMDPLRVAARTPFVEVDLARINPENKIMDGRTPDEVASELEEMHNAGKGVIGMKILGEGAFKEPERRDASLRFVLGLSTVNAFIIGFEDPAQVDDIVTRTNNAIAFLSKQP